MFCLDILIGPSQEDQTVQNSTQDLFNEGQEPIDETTMRNHPPSSSKRNSGSSMIFKRSSFRYKIFIGCPRLSSPFVEQIRVSSLFNATEIFPNLLHRTAFSTVENRVVPRTISSSQSIRTIYSHTGNEQSNGKKNERKFSIRKENI